MMVWATLHKVSECWVDGEWEGGETERQCSLQASLGQGVWGEEWRIGFFAPSSRSGSVGFVECGGWGSLHCPLGQGVLVWWSEEEWCSSPPTRSGSVDLVECGGCGSLHCPLGHGVLE